MERVLQRELAAIPTVFGRLVFLASLHRDGRYAHPAFDRLMDPEEGDRILCHRHHQVFSQWLRLTLEEQTVDLADYLNSPEVSETALDYSALIPRSSHEVERQLYLTDFETVMELLHLHPGGADDARKS